MSYTRLDDLYSLHNRLVDDYNDPDKPFEQMEEDRLLTYDLIEKIESGLLVELPCKVGDTVYFIEYFCYHKGCSSYKQAFCCGCLEMIERERIGEKYVISQKKFKLEDLNEVNKTLFTTQEAAEARLKELQDKK